MIGILVLASLLLAAAGALARGASARITTGVGLVISASLAGAAVAQPATGVVAPWIPAFGASFSLMVTPLSAALCAVVSAIGLLAVILEDFPADRPGAYGALLLAAIASVEGALLSQDLLLLLCCFEAGILPAWALVAIWGGADREPAANRLFVLQHVGTAALLVAAVALVVVHHRQSGEWTFDLDALRSTMLVPSFATALLAALVAGFAARMPAFPLHGWLADAAAGLPAGAAIVVVGALGVAGSWTIVRVAPVLAAAHTGVLLAVATAGVFYAGFLAFSQNELRRVIALLAVARGGLVLLGGVAWTETSVRGVFLSLLAHAASIAGLLVVTAMIERRMGTSDLDRLGGLWGHAPRLTFAGIFFALAVLGLPGLGTFAGEFLVLAGAWSRAPSSVALTSLGLLGATLVLLGVVHRAWLGRPGEEEVPDVDGRESALLFVLMAAVLLLGVDPQPLLDLVEPSFGAWSVR